MVHLLAQATDRPGPLGEQLSQLLGLLLVAALTAACDLLRRFLAARRVATTVAQGVEAGEVRLQSAVQAELAKVLGARAAEETSRRLAKVTKQTIAVVAAESGVAEAVDALAHSEPVADARDAAVRALAAALVPATPDPPPLPAAPPRLPA